MPSWSQDQEFKLLLAIINLTNPKPPNWNEVAQKMGCDFTKEACRQHFQKIKRDNKGAGGSSSVPSTPVKNRVAKTPTSQSSKRKKAPAAKPEDQDDDSTAPFIDLDGDDSPAKKMKQEPELTAPQFKTELPEGGVLDLEDERHVLGRGAAFKQQPPAD
ncbi:MAG: hypothetical protein M1837_007423 [Sclerophora amabilis]|nr:MAG: hypothetical protein M1837_007423 [Sclerophora amabilis]